MEQLNWLDARQAAQGIRDGLFSAEDLVQACIEQIQAREPEVQAWAYFDPGACPGAGAQCRRMAGRRQAARAAAWHTGRHQGHHRHRRHADRRRHAAACRSHAVARRQGGRAAARRRRGHHGQDGDHRAGHLFARQDAQSAQPGTHARRLVERLRRRGGRRHGAAGAGHADQRLGDPAGRLLRRVRFQAQPRPDLVSAASCASRSVSISRAASPAASRTSPCSARYCAAYDADEAGMLPRATLPLQRVCDEEPPLPPKLALIKTPLVAAARCRRPGGVCRELVEHLGGHVGEFELPDSAAKALDWHKTHHGSRDCRQLRGRLRSAAPTSCLPRCASRSNVGAQSRQSITCGRPARIPVVTEALDEIFDRYDAILTPAVPGAAPHGLGSTGNPMFCTLWTFCGMPCHQPAAAAGRQRPAGGRATGRSGRRRCAAAAHRTLAGRCDRIT